MQRLFGVTEVEEEWTADCLRGGRLRDEGWEGASCTAAAVGRFRDGRCGCLICFTQQPSLCCIPDPYGGKGLSFGAVRLARCKSQVKSSQACRVRTGARVVMRSFDRVDFHELARDA